MPDASTRARITITIKGLEFPYEPIYHTGHVCTEAEARILDKVRADSLRNVFARKLEKGPVANEAIQAEWRAYLRDYELGMRHGAADPIDALAHKLAREAVLSKTRQLGIDPRSKTQDWLDAQIAKALDTNSWFIEEASRRIAATREAAEQVIDLDI